MSSGNQPSVRFRRIGGALRQAREEAGMTLETAGRKFGRSSAWLSTVENGLQAIRIDDLTELLDFYQVPEGPLRESLLHLAAQSRRKNWTRTYKGRISAAALDYASVEADSALIRTFQPSLVPGLLQTEGYTRALIAAGLPKTTPDTAKLVAFRMARQAILTRSNPPKFRAVIGESALRQRVGGDTAMCAQLNRLIDTTGIDHLEIHVLPYSAGAHLWLSGQFDLFALRPPGQLTVAVLEQTTKISFLEDEQEVADHEEIFDYLLAAALSESRSRALIEQILSEL